MSIKGAEASTPFDEVTIVVKVMNKMFAMIPTDNEVCSVTLKCNPEKLSTCARLMIAWRLHFI